MKKLVALMAVVACVQALSAYELDYYAAHSKLASGRWVKIKVEKSGMQQVTSEQLKQWGFDHPEDVSIFGYGGALLTNEFSTDYVDDLPAQPVYRTDDGRILFYGESDVVFRNNYSDIWKVKIRRNTSATAGYYFVTDAYPGASRTVKGGGDPTLQGLKVRDHYCTTVFEDEVENTSRGGYRWFGTDFSDKAEQSYTFKIKNPLPSDGEFAEGRVSFEWMGNLSSDAALGMSADFAYDRYDNAMISVPGDREYYSLGSGYIAFVPTGDASKDYTVKFSAPSVKFSSAALDYVSVIYQRTNDLSDIDQQLMAFRQLGANSNMLFTNASSNVQIWSVDNAAAPYLYRSRFNTSNQLTVRSKKTLSGEHAYVMAFNPERQMHTVEYAGEVANQDLHSLPVPDMLIITSRAFMA